MSQSKITEPTEPEKPVEEQPKKRKLDETETPVAEVAKSMLVTDVLAVDIEASGMNLYSHFMGEFGASWIKIGEKEPRESFYRSLQQPNNTGWSPETLRTFWEKPDKHGVKPITGYDERRKRIPPSDCYTAMDDFVDWVRACDAKVTAEGGLMLIITDTADFDGSWINSYLSRYSSKAVTLSEILGRYQPTRDISSFMLGVGGAMQPDGSSELAINALGLSKDADWGEKYAHNHDPESDSKHIAARASFILTHCKKK